MKLDSWKTDVTLGKSSKSYGKNFKNMKYSTKLKIELDLISQAFNHILQEHSAGFMENYSLLGYYHNVMIQI